MKIFQSILAIVFVLFTTIQLDAQVNPAQEAMIQSELKKRGLNEAEVRVKLEQRGIDMDNMSPEEALSLQSVFEEIEQEIKAEKAADSAPNVSSEAPVLDESEVIKKVERVLDELDGQPEQTIQEAVGEITATGTTPEGATAEDIIAEKLSEEATSNLPPTTIYGQQLFRDKTLAVFSRSNEVIPDNSYILGPGDIVNVSIFGASQAEGSYEVKPGGYIQPDGMSRINLKGISLGKAKDLLRGRFAQFYQFGSGEFAVTISKTRDITVNIFGEVYNPGSYNIAATNTAFNALVASGGPTDIGSMRKIRLIRGGEKPKYIDVYEFMMNPATQEKYFLQDNDILFVDAVEKIVSITGAVKRPFKYELLDNENLISLIEYAGSFKQNAYLNAIQLKRFENNEEKLIDVNLKQLRASSSDYILLDGDEIVVRTIPKPYQNYVEIKGSVELPGRYQLENRMKVSDLLGKGIIKEEARTDIAFMLRTNPDKTIQFIKINLDTILSNPNSPENITLQPKDHLSIYTLESYIDKASISIGGAVRNPLQYPFDPNESIRVQDAILLAGGLEQGATTYGYIKRTDPTNPKLKDYIRVNLFEALDNNNSPENQILKPGDIITVYTKSRFTDASTVSISGAVRAPSTYDFDEGLRISDLIYFSGGLEQGATTYGYIKRTDPTNTKLKNYIRVNLFEALNNNNSPENQILKPGDAITVYTKSRYTDAATISIVGAVRDPSAYDFDEGLRISDLVYLSGGLNKDATDFAYLIRTDTTNQLLKEYIRINLKEALSDSLSYNNRYLEPFDQIRVLSKSTFTDISTVRISGAVRNPGEFQFDESLTLEDALTLAGGLRLGAAANRIDIFRLKMDKNQPIRTIVATVQVGDYLNSTSKGIDLQPFDQVVVREVPDFEFQQSVTISGEVQYPGTYALIGDNEKLLSILKRAGGLSSEAFPEGATLYRKDDNLGFVLTKLDKTLKRPRSRFNYFLKAGDIITIPKTKELVTVNLTNTQAAELYPDKMLTGGKLNMAYKRGKNAKWYINKYAAGLSKDASKKKISVEYPNGRLKKTRNFGLFKIYPRLKKGAVVSIGVKPSKNKKEERNNDGKKSDTDWEKIVGNTVAQVTAILSLVLLLQQIN